MSMHMGMGQGQRMDMRPSPSLIQFTEILQLSGVELQNVIEQAVADNPALELAEVDLCPVCGAALMADGWCLQCRQRERMDGACPVCGNRLTDGICLRCRRGDELVEDAARALVEPEDERDQFDFLLSIADQRGLHEHLLEELRMVLDAADMPIAEYLVGELDERGFLDVSLDLVAHTLGADPARVEAVLAALQSVGPLGLGARSVQECLLLQLDRWESIGVACPLAREMIDGHLEALGRGQFGQLARRFGVTHDDIVAVRDFIRTHLRPYPIAEEVDVAPWERQSGPGFIAPDVIVRPGKEPDALDIEVVESRRFRLSINPLYREIVEHLDAGRTAGEPLTANDTAHVQAHVNRARQFLSHIQDRREIMHKVAAYVMARQTAFLQRGPRHLAPLTRAEVAEALGVHESTVSRATAGKYVLLTNRQIVPFAMFFKAALSVQDVLREIVANEDHPLTDAELSDLLAARGLRVARRTVAKYREQMGILPSSLR
ncbi:RNA polymerase sigma-54 factor [bacterium]|nr:RNA polymerase sigma-54 factor [Chloroflexi bacterium CFX6]RIL11591.1 MAG: RNA polymerase sigma-54 factor [bacterium]